MPWKECSVVDERLRFVANVGLRGVILGIQRVEVLLKPMVGGHAGVDRAAD
jgi:hypothetical protein